MIKWLSVLWVVTCVASTPVTDANAKVTKEPVKQTSKTIKTKIESLTVQRLPQEAVRIQEQSTLENRKSIAIKAERLIRNAGVTSDKMIIAMLANAWHESNWSPKLEDHSCIGFFQLHVRYMGKGSTVTQLKNLNYNVLKLMASSDFKDWVKWCKSNPRASAGQMSYRFASHVERCASRYRFPRKITADKWFNSLKAV